MGYDVRTTTSSTAALEMVAESPDYFDLMIIGLVMPNMSGDELARRIMEIRGKMPIILCTGHSDSIDAAGAKVMGISAFVLKPIEKQAIAATVRRLLDQR